MAKTKLLQGFRKSVHVEIIIALITIVIRTSDEFDVRKENVLLGDLLRVVSEDSGSSENMKQAARLADIRLRAMIDQSDSHCLRDYADLHAAILSAHALVRP